MLKTQKDQLFILIKSLTKAEKRNFRLYVTRFQSGGDTKFLQLFDALDRMGEYDEKAVIKKIVSIEKKQLANLKRHLYKQILTSLRLIHIQKNIDIQIREQVDFARILYGKGMYMQSLKILDRIKQIAVDHHQDVLHLEILEFQKMIEVRHVTHSRQVENKMERLLMESLQRSQITHDINLLSALHIQIHGYYIQHGHTQNKADQEALLDYFNTHMPDGLDKRQLTFFEKTNLYQSWMWYHYINLNLDKGRESAGQWVNLFMENPHMREKDPDLYIRSLYYLMIFHFLSAKKEDFHYYLQKMEDFASTHQEDFNDNSSMLVCVYSNLSYLNYYLLNHKFEEGVAQIESIQNQLLQYNQYIDEYRILLFDYKFAYLHFGIGQFEEALDYLNKIVLIKNPQLPKDLQIYASLLQLICLYETKQYDLMSYFISPLSRTIHKYRGRNKTQSLLLDLLKKIVAIPPSEASSVFTAFKHKELQTILNSAFEQKAIRYLRPDVWIKSHTDNCTVKEATMVLENV